MKKKDSILEAVEAQVVNAAQDYVKGKIKKKLMRIGEFSVLVFLAFVMISIGIAHLIGFYFPAFNNGLNFVLVGMMFLLAGIILRF